MFTENTFIKCLNGKLAMENSVKAEIPKKQRTRGYRKTQQFFEDIIACRMIQNFKRI